MDFFLPAYTLIKQRYTTKMVYPKRKKSLGVKRSEQNRRRLTIEAKTRWRDILLPEPNGVSLSVISFAQS